MNGISVWRGYLFEFRMLIYTEYFDTAKSFPNIATLTYQNSRPRSISGHGTTVPARGNSPSILEGVAEGRGSNIGIRIPCDYQKDLPEGRSSYVQEILVLILVLIIFNNVFPQIVQHYVHVL